MRSSLLVIIAGLILFHHLGQDPPRPHVLHSPSLMLMVPLPGVVFYR